MNAVISGQAGVALLLDGEEISSLRAGRPGEVVRRNPNDLPLLFGDAKDLQFLEAAAVEEVSSRLERASDAVDALHLALILLDESLSHDTRRTAADELEDLLEIEENHRFVENILHAHPLPRGADLGGALAVCPGSANLTRRLLESLGALQGVITEVYFAWEQIPEVLFEGKRDRSQTYSIAAREGFFRDLVAFRATKGSIDQFLIVALLNESFRRVRKQRHILSAWLFSLLLEPWSEPRRGELDLKESSVAENAEDDRQWLQQGAQFTPQDESQKVAVVTATERYYWHRTRDITTALLIQRWGFTSVQAHRPLIDRVLSSQFSG